MSPESMLKLLPKDTINTMVRERGPEVLGAMVDYLFTITTEEQPKAVPHGVLLIPTVDGDIMATVRGKLLDEHKQQLENTDLATYSVKRLLATLDLNKMLE